MNKYSIDNLIELANSSNSIIKDDLIKVVAKYLNLSEIAESRSEEFILVDVNQLKSLTNPDDFKFEPDSIGPLGVVVD